jgi:hypothetical protein
VQFLPEALAVGARVVQGLLCHHDPPKAIFASIQKLA